jgi:hypothetical protein
MGAVRALAGVGDVSGNVLLLGAGTYEPWMRVALRPPWQLELDTDILAANCRTGQWVLSAHSLGYEPTMPMVNPQRRTGQLVQIFAY